MKWLPWVLVAVSTGCSPRPIPIVSPLMSPIIRPIPLVGSMVGSKPATLLHEPFNAIDPTRWREIEVKGRTEFSIEELDGRRVLKAHSHAHASILLCQVGFDPGDYPWVNWRWRVDHLLEQENLATKPGSDAPARVYVYFDTPGLPWQKRNLDYVWSSLMPVGTILPSAYSKTSMILVVDSGPQHLGQWRAVSRNIFNDYRAVFPGEREVPDVLAIGLLTDADSTSTMATAYYDDVLVTREAAFPSPDEHGAIAAPVP